MQKKIIRGAIFCQDATIRPCRNGSPWRTSGNQKWHGANPNLNARAMAIKINEKSFKGVSTDQEPVNHAWIKALFSRRAALKAWIRKYFIVASTFRGEKLEIKIGTRASVLNSSPTQITNHFCEKITILVPSTTVVNKNMRFTRYIELEGSLTLINLIIS